MSSVIESSTAAALRRAAVRATLAPSMQNTQPWRFELHGESLDVYADRTRRLRALDPTGRQVIISYACAVFNVRAALAGVGFDAIVRSMPDPARLYLLASIGARGRGGPTPGPMADYDSVLDRRRTNRRPFTRDSVASEVLVALVAAVEAEQAQLVIVRGKTAELALNRLIAEAEQLRLADREYQSELRAWTFDHTLRPDAVSETEIPNVDGPGLLLVLCTERDGLSGWMQAGQALERMWLEATRRGVAVSPMTQIIEVPATRAAMRLELGLAVAPQVLVRVGYAPDSPATRRRLLLDVLVERPAEATVRP